MTIIHADSMDGYTSQAGLNMGYGGNTNTVSILAGQGRFGGNLIQVNGKLSVPVPATDTIITQCAYKISSASSSGSGIPVVTFQNAFGKQCYGDVGADSSLRFWRYAPVNDVFLGSTPAGFLSSLSLKWFSIKAKVNATTGFFEVRNPDGSLVVSLTGLNTKGRSEDGLITTVDHGPQSSSYPQFIDDWIVLDTNGSAPYNDWTKDLGGRHIKPSAAGNQADFPTLVGNATHWGAVSEADPDGDTSYVASATVGHRELYQHTALPAGPTSIFCVVGMATWRASDAGGRTGGMSIRSGGTTANAPGSAALQPTYRTDRFNMIVNPVTGVAFTPAELRAPIEAGPLVVA